MSYSYLSRINSDDGFVGISESIMPSCRRCHTITMKMREIVTHIEAKWTTMLYNHYDNTHTHNRFTALLKYVRDNPGEQVPERYNQEG